MCGGGGGEEVVGGYVGGCLKGRYPACYLFIVAPPSTKGRVNISGVGGRRVQWSLHINCGGRRPRGQSNASCGDACHLDASSRAAVSGCKATFRSGQALSRGVGRTFSKGAGGGGVDLNGNLKKRLFLH